MFLNTMFLFSVAKVRRISNTHQIYKQKNVNFCFFIDLNQNQKLTKAHFGTNVCCFEIVATTYSD